MTHSATLSALAARQAPSLSPSPTVLTAESGHGLEIPGGNFLLTADFHRVGGDLLLVGKDGHEVVVRDYFSSHTPPDLISGTGGVIHSDLASRLAGAIAPGQWAEDGAPQAQLHAIGEIQKLSGVVKVHHIDGKVETLQQGATVFQGDVLETAGDGGVGIVFVDRSTFSLGKNGRMVMDELVYDPQSHTGHSSMSVVQGTFSFVSGQIAKSGPDSMSIKTPVMTIGIRGTTVAGTAAAEGSQNTVALLSDEDGGVGQIVVANEGGAPQILTVPNQALQISSAFQAPPPPVVLPPSILHQIMPDLHNVQETRPAQPSTDPKINGNSSSEQPAPKTDAPQGQNGEKPAPPEQPIDKLAPDAPGTPQTPPSDSVLTPPPVIPTAPLSTPVPIPVPVPVPVPTPVPTPPPPTPTTPVTPPVTHTTTLNVTPSTDSQSIFLGTSGADSFTGGSGTNTFIGHGGNDVITLGSSTNILVMDSHAHGEVVSDSVSSGATNIVNASALNGGFAGAVASANGDLVISYDSAAGGGTSTFKNYYTTDHNVLTVIGNGSSDVMTFLKDTVGAQTADLVLRTGDGEFIHTSTAQLHEIIGTSGNDIIIGSTDDLILLGGSNAMSGGASGKDSFILEGMGGAVIGGASGHNSAFFNHLQGGEDENGILFDFTGDHVATITLGGVSQVANVAVADGKTTYLTNVHSVWGSNSGDIFVGGEGVTSSPQFSLDFHAGTGANTIVDASTISYSENLIRVTAIYESSGSGITADLAYFDYRMLNSYSWGGGSVSSYGYVYHDGSSDALYGVSQVEGSAFNDTLIGSANGSYFVSSLGNDRYAGNTFNGLTTEQNAVEVSYADSGSGVVINLTKGALIVTETLSNGSIVTAVLAAESAFHDGGYTDSLTDVEKVQLASGYSGKVYGDGTAVLDMSSSDITTMTANLTSGQAYGWQAGVTESFQNLGGLVDYTGSSDFVVTSTSLKTSLVWGNSSASTLDLSALGSSVFLDDHISGSVHSGTAYLIDGNVTTQLAYGGITALNASASATVELDLSGLEAGVTVFMSNHEVIGQTTASFQNIDIIQGTSHDDLFFGKLDGTTFVGGGGSDELSYSHSTNAVTVDMTSGHAWNASSGTDHLSDISVIQGSTGNDLILANAGTGATYMGGGGIDLLSYANVSNGVTIDLANHEVFTSTGTDVFSGFSDVVGSAGNDTVFLSTSMFTSALPFGTNASWSGWSASSYATTLTASTQGNVQHEVFTYGEGDYGGGITDSWGVQTTATQSGTQVIHWDYSWFHEWFYAGASLSYKINGVDQGFLSNTAAAEGQGPHEFSGDITLSLTSGDVVEFDMSGSNEDANSHLYGTLDLSVTLSPTLDGGAGDNELVLTGSSIVDSNFGHIFNYETLVVEGASAVMLGASADLAGIRTVDLSADSSIQSFDASGMSDGVTVIVPTAMLSGHSFQGNSSGTGASDLRVTGDYAHLSGTNLSGASNIDVLDLGGSNDTLTLTNSAVNSLTKATNAVSGDNHSLIIIGDSTATVSLVASVGNWVAGGTVNETVHGSSHSYTVYNNAAANEHVYVDSNITHVTTSVT